MKIAVLAWLIAAPLAWADAPCRVADSAFLGDWQAAGGRSSYQLFSLSREDDGTPRFDSWLHERPDTFNARWQRDGCRIVVTKPGVPGMSAFRLTRDKRGRWQLMDETALPEPGRYKRFQPRRR